MGGGVEVVRTPQKPVPEEVAKAWAREWVKEGKEVDWQSLLPPRGFKVLPRRWVVERTFSCLGQNRRMNKDYEREEVSPCLRIIRQFLEEEFSEVRNGKQREVVRVRRWLRAVRLAEEENGGSRELP